MDPLWSETRWSNFKYFKYFIIILIVSTNYIFVHLLDNKVFNSYLEFIFLVNSQVNFSHYPCAWHMSAMQSSAIGTAKFSCRVTCVGTVQEQIQFIQRKLRCEPAWNILTDRLTGSTNQRPNTATGDGCVLTRTHKHLVLLVILSHCLLVPINCHFSTKFLFVDALLITLRVILALFNDAFKLLKLCNWVIM